MILYVVVETTHNTRVATFYEEDVAVWFSENHPKYKGNSVVQSAGATF